MTNWETLAHGAVVAKSNMKETYETYRELGIRRDAAKTLAMSDATRDDFLKASKTLDFEEHQVRIAAVHTRLDVAMVCY